MLKRYWFVFFAFGLVVSASHAQEQTPENPVEPDTAQEQAAEQSAIEDAPIIFMLPTEPSGSEHNGGAAEDGQEDAAQHLIFGDGWAQWIMAGVGFLALVVSAWAVWLLKDTLEATRDAVKSADDAVTVTREIGQAQTRAYVSCTGGTFVLHQQLCDLRIHLKNFGNSPAKRVDVKARLLVSDMRGDHFKTAFGEGELYSIPAGVEEERPLRLLLRFSQETTSALRDGERLAIAEVHIKWWDVFGDEQEDSFFLTEIRDTSGFAKAPNGIKLRSGKMKASATRQDESSQTEA